MIIKSKLNVFVLAGAVLVSGCASGGLNYPSTSNIDKVTRKTLSPSEQKAVIEDLQGAGTTEPNAPKPLIKATTSPSS